MPARFNLLRPLSLILSLSILASLLAVSSLPASATAPAASATSASLPLAWEISLTSDRAEFRSDEKFTLTATTNQSIAGTSWKIFLVDSDSGLRVGQCSTPSTTTCAKQLSFKSGGPKTYHATVAQSDEAPQASSPSVTVQRAPWSVSLQASRTIFAAGEPVTLTATANQPIVDGDFSIHIYDATTGRRLTNCYARTDALCTVSTTFSTGPTHTYYAEVGRDNPLPTGVAADVQATSNRVQLKRLPWTVTLSQDATNLIATTNQSIKGASTYGIHIYGGTGLRIMHCIGGGAYTTTCTRKLANTTGPYLATVANSTGGDVQATSAGFSAPTGQLGNSDDQAIGGGNPSENNCQCDRADPVNTATGEFYENITDLTIPGRMPISWTRSYSSTRDENTGLGRGWTSILDAGILQPTDPSTPVKVTQENGSVSRFWPTSNGQFSTNAPNTTASLTRATDTGTWTLTRRDGTALVFGTAGRLLRVSDRNNESVTLERGDGSHPDRVTALVGDAGNIGFDYNAAGLISEATGPGNQTYDYAYDASDRLVTVTNPLGKIRRYEYDSNHRVITMIAPDQGTVTNEYDSEGRVIVQTDSLEGETAFSYGAEGGASTLTWTTVTDQAGRATKYTYDNAWLVKRTLAPASSEPRVWSFANGPTGQPVEITDPLGNVTAMTYNARGDLTSATTPVGAVTSFTYNEFGDVKTMTDPKGTVTRNTFNPAGNLTTISTPLNTTQSALQSFGYGNPAHPGDVTGATDPRGNDTTVVYDAAGRLLSTTSPSGAVESRTYTAAGLLASLTDARGNVPGAAPAAHTTELAYNAMGRVTSVTKPGEGTVAFAYDANNRVVKTTDAIGAETTSTYDTAGRVLATTNARGKTTSFTYDPAGLVTSVTQPGGAKTTYAYTVFGDVKSVTGPEGNVAGASETVREAATITYTYDAAGRAIGTSVPDPDGGHITTSSTYDDAGRPLSQQGPLGDTTHFEYDSNGNTVKVVDAEDRSTTYVYDKANRLIASTNPDGHTTEYGYDLGSNRVREISPAGRTSTWAYDVDGRLSATVTPRGNEPGADPVNFRTTYGYDLASNLTSITDALGHTTTYEYDNAQRPVVATDARGKVTSTTYDQRGLPVEVTNPDGGQVAYTYDPTGNPLTSTNPLGGVTTYTYDADGQLVTVTDPKNRSKELGYDIAGLLAEVETARGVTTYESDALGRTTGITYSDTTPDVAYGYDRAGQRTSMTDGVGTTAYAYDLTGRLLSADGPLGQFEYGYDLTGNKVSTVGPNGSTTAAFDPDGYPSNVENGATYFDYTYDLDGRLVTKENLYNNTATTYERNPLGQVVRQTVTPGVGQTETRDYTYDATGNQSALTITRGTGPNATVKTRTSQYDNAGRLTGECATVTPCTSTAANLSWVYDLAGNILSKHDQAGDTTFAYDTAGQTISQTISGAGGGSTTDTYIYDASGNLTDDGTRTYGYDLAGRTTNITNPAQAPATGNSTTTYTYDGEGNRATATADNGPATTYTWDINSAVPMLTSEDTGSSVQSYNYSPDGSPLSMHLDATTPADWFYLTDSLGSVTDVTSTNGERVTSYDYTPYGEQRGPPVADTSGAPAHQPFRFAGEYFDTNTGLYNLRARLYDPAAGRFTTTDPIGGAGDLVAGGTLYAYANNNPLAFTDPSGLAPDPWGNLFDFLSGGGQKAGDTAEAVLPLVVNSDNPEARASAAANLVAPVVSNVSTTYHENGGGVFGWFAVAQQQVYWADDFNADFNGIVEDIVSGDWCSVGSSAASMAMAVVGGKIAPKGGVYSLRDGDEIVRTGRAKTFSDRRSAHNRDPVLGQFEFRKEYETDDYGQQRGLEHYIYENNPQAMSANGGYNKIGAISPRNKKKDGYLRAAEDFLSGGGNA